MNNLNSLKKVNVQCTDNKCTNVFPDANDEDEKVFTLGEQRDELSRWGQWCITAPPTTRLPQAGSGGAAAGAGGAKGRAEEGQRGQGPEGGFWYDGPGGEGEGSLPIQCLLVVLYLYLTQNILYPTLFYIRKISFRIKRPI